MFRIKSTLAASVASCALFVSSSFAGELVFNTDASDAAPRLRWKRSLQASRKSGHNS